MDKFLELVKGVARCNLPMLPLPENEELMVYGRIDIDFACGCCKQIHLMLGASAITSDVEARLTSITAPLASDVEILVHTINASTDGIAHQKPHLIRLNQCTQFNAIVTVLGCEPKPLSIFEGIKI